MKKALRQQTGDVRSEQAGRGECIPDGISAGICPNCGKELYPGVVDKDYGEIVVFGCSQCEWINYLQATSISADRHGLV